MSPDQPPSTYGHGADFNTRNQLYTLSIPTDAPWVRIRSDGVFVPDRANATFTVDGAIRQTTEWAPNDEQRPAWNGYGLEIIGVQVDYLPDPNFPSFRTRGPFWRLDGDDRREIYVEIWLYRVLIHKSHLSIDFITGHGHEPWQRRDVSLKGLGFTHTQADANRAIKARALVLRLEEEHRGRPKTLSKVTARRRLVDAAIRADTATDRAYSKGSLLLTIPILSRNSKPIRSHRTISDWLSAAEWSQERGDVIRALIRHWQRADTKAKWNFLH